jgi:hypothetical protein
MNTPIEIRASSLPRLFACRASALRSVGAKFEDSPAAKRGRDMADAIASFVRLGRDKALAVLEKDETLGPADKKIVEDCFNLSLTLVPEGTERKIEVEREVGLGFMGVKAGRFDWYSQALDVMKLVQGVMGDWKMGVGEVEIAEFNKQLWAYLAGKMKEIRDTGAKMESIEGFIAQPSAWKADRRLTSHTFSYDELKTRVMEIQGVVKEARSDNPLAITGDHCKFCPAKPSCPEYQAMAAGTAQAKQEERTAALATVTEGTVVEVIPDEILITPVQIVSLEVIEESQAKLALARDMRVTDEATFQTAGMMRKELSRLWTLVDDSRKMKADPFFRFKQKIDEAAKKALVPLKQGIDALDADATAYQRKKKAEAEEVERKRKEEAEAANKAVELAAKKKAAEEKAIADREAAEKAAKDAVGKKAKAEAEAKAQEAREKEAKAKAASEKADLEARQKEIKAQDLPAAAPVQTSTAGMKLREKWKFSIPDYSKVPASLVNTILTFDEKVVAALHKSGKITEANSKDWLIIIDDSKVGGSR